MRTIGSAGLFVVSAAFLSGCASPFQFVKTTRVHRAMEAREPKCNIDIFLSEEEIKRPYEVVCELQSNTGTTIILRRDLRGALEIAREEACACGGNAIFAASSQKKRLGLNSATLAEIKVVKYK